MYVTGFRYRVNVHARFSTAENKGFTTSKMIRHDSSGSDIRVKGPYALSVEGAIKALETDLWRKILQKVAEPEKATDSDWTMNPLTKATDGARGDEPDFPCTTWAGVNVSIVPQDDHSGDEADEEAEEEGRCDGEYVQLIDQAGFFAGILRP